LAVAITVVILLPSQAPRDGSSSHCGCCQMVLMTNIMKLVEKLATIASALFYFILFLKVTSNVTLEK
jgi:hypothetical protein